MQLEIDSVIPPHALAQCCECSAGLVRVPSGNYLCPQGHGRLYQPKDVCAMKFYTVNGNGVAYALAGGRGVAYARNAEWMEKPDCEVVNDLLLIVRRVPELVPARLIYRGSWTECARCKQQPNGGRVVMARAKDGFEPVYWCDACRKDEGRKWRYAT